MRNLEEKVEKRMRVEKLMRGNFFIYNYHEDGNSGGGAEPAGCCCFLKYFCFSGLLITLGFLLGVFA